MTENEEERDERFCLFLLLITSQPHLAASWTSPTPGKQWWKATKYINSSTILKYMYFTIFYDVLLYTSHILFYTIALIWQLILLVTLLIKLKMSLKYNVIL